MKIAVGSEGYSLNSKVSEIFGRSSAFIIVNLENKEIKRVSVIDNRRKIEANINRRFLWRQIEDLTDFSGMQKPNVFAVANRKFANIEIIDFGSHKQNKSGTGSTAAQIIVDHEVNALICGKLGPVAFHILKNSGINVYKITSGNVEKNLKRFMEYKLKEITSLSSGFPQ